ncbi:hypothetical protein HEP87_64085 [Streptomyces sp. S1D4-11]
MLQRLDAYGLTVHEGYGLSENSSVVSWNFPGAVRFGTVGRPLDHVRAELAEDGELLIRSTSLFAGYTREDPSSVVVDDQGRLHTGDLAEIDADGYLRITGRKKNLVITAGGRNVAPEWVEARYRELGFVREAAVVADGLDQVHGLFVIDKPRPRHGPPRDHRLRQAETLRHRTRRRRPPHVRGRPRLRHLLHRHRTPPPRRRARVRPRPAPHPGPRGGETKEKA